MALTSRASPFALCCTTFEQRVGASEFAVLDKGRHAALKFVELVEVKRGIAFRHVRYQFLVILLRGIECLKLLAIFLQRNLLLLFQSFKFVFFLLQLSLKRAAQKNPTGLTATGCLAMQLLGYGKEKEVSSALEYMRGWKPAWRGVTAWRASVRNCPTCANRAPSSKTPTATPYAY